MSTYTVNYFPEGDTEASKEVLDRMRDFAKDTFENGNPPPVYAQVSRALHTIMAAEQVRTPNRRLVTKSMPVEIIHYRGWSLCRVCGGNAGNSELKIHHGQNIYRVPEGVMHYVDFHGILPLLVRETPDGPEEISDRFLKVLEALTGISIF